MPQYTKFSIYGYTPTEAWCIAFVVLFSLTAAIHTAQATRAKTWIVYPTLVLGALIEVLGWAGRLWSSRNVLLLTPFLMQICTLILSPVFFSAYLYCLLGQAINAIGPQFSVIPPKLYLAIFLTADIISLILQAVGGGQAASSASSSAPTSTATNIMVAGIIFQLISMAVFIACAIDFFLRAQTRRSYSFREQKIAANLEKDFAKARSNSDSTLATGSPDVVVQDKEIGSTERGDDSKHQISRWKIMMIGVGISSAMIFVRGIYRSIELVQGWDGYLISHEIYQNVLDGIPMVIAVAIFNVVNPGYILPKKTGWKGYH